VPEAAPLVDETDRTLANELHETEDPRRFVEKLFTYYYDNARAQRTSRELMYLHLGMATSVIMKVARGAAPEEK
jgi:hypothetical protein